MDITNFQEFIKDSDNKDVEVHGWTGAIADDFCFVIAWSWELVQTGPMAI